MRYGEKTSVKGKNLVSVDTKAGSLAYNQFDMQASQALHMLIIFRVHITSERLNFL